MEEYKAILKLINDKLEEQEGVIEYYRKITAEKDNLIQDQQCEIYNLKAELKSATEKETPIKCIRCGENEAIHNGYCDCCYGDLFGEECAK